MQLLYKDFKRRRFGRCNLCGKTRQLTWDHVPPKGGIELLPVDIDRVISRFIPALKQVRPEISNDGLGFRTLCGRCNSLLSDYDEALNSLALTAGRFLNSVLLLPPIVRLEARPTAIARAILGHLLAARLGVRDTFFDSMTRAVVLDPDVNIPSQLNINYWPYPHKTQIILRDCLMPKKRGDFSEFQQFGLLKYFPLAYLVTDAPEYEDLPSLTVWRNEPSNTIIELPIDFRRIYEVDWPEAPADGNFLFAGAEGLESVQAHPFYPKWKTRLR